MTTNPTNLPLHGAVDLSALRAPATAAASRPGVVDVTEATFSAEVVERSASVPVVLDFWAAWCGPCKALSPVLEKLAGEAAGSWILAKIDVDANPRLAQAAAVQGIPAVKAVVDGAVVAEFTGVLPEAEVRSFIASVLALAAGEPAAPPGPDPDAEQATEALRKGDLGAARAAFERLAARDPGDAGPKRALASLDLLERTRTVDSAQARRAAQAAPSDVAAAIVAADVDFAQGRPADGVGRLLALVRASSGEDRDRARRHLLLLLETLDPADPQAIRARRDLANAIF